MSAINKDVIDASNSGNTIAQIVGTGSISKPADEGSVSKAIAITQVDNSKGSWQYKLSGASSWSAISASTGVVPLNSAALLLGPTDSLRFVPNADANGTASFRFRAWDGTTGTAGSSANAQVVGGSTAFSAIDDSASITINPVNDAPQISKTGSDADASSLSEANAGLSASGTLTVSDVDGNNTVTAAVQSMVKAGITTGLGSNDAALLGMLSVTPSTVLSSPATSASLTWAFNSGSEAFNYLSAGEQLTLTYTLKATDSAATPLHATTTVTITVTGSNDGPSARRNAASPSTMLPDALTPHSWSHRTTSSPDHSWMSGGRRSSGCWRGASRPKKPAGRRSWRNHGRSG